MTPELEKKLGALPDSPGVYVFQDSAGKAIYVGKARSLRKRVRQYFAPSPSDTRFFVQNVRRLVADIEVFATAGDREALVLENTLIKERRPRYNVRLRDDKDYLCIRIDPKAEWPRLELERRPGQDGARHYGPYPSARTARGLVRFLTRHFQLRSCKDSVFASRSRPCLQHDIGRCLAPCTLEVDPDLYRANVEQAILYLEGRVDDLVRRLRAEMDGLSASMQYEEAAEVRDRLRTIEASTETQRVLAVSGIDQDAVGIARSGDRTALACLFFRRGRLVGQKEERLRTGLPDAEILASFVSQFHGGDRPPVDEVLLPSDIEDMAGLERAVSGVQGRAVRLLSPRRGRRRDLVRLASENADRILAAWDRTDAPSLEKLEKLGERLSLPSPPSRIECVDISHTSGREAVGSLAVLLDAAPAPSRYRRFRIRSASPGDDYACMHEVLSRRFRRAFEGQEGWEQPDLLVVDGGRGQLRVAEEVLREIGVSGVAVCAIAKDRRREIASEARSRVRARLGAPAPAATGHDTVYLPGRVTGIPVRGASPFSLLTLLRDEAHRFAVSYHRKLRSKESLSTALLRIPGVGPATARRLLAAFGSVAGIRAATEDEIASAGVPRPLAARILAALGPAGP